MTYGYFADLLRHEGKFREAIAHLKKAVEFDGEYTWAWRELAELRGLTGKHDEAEAAYRAAVRLEPDEAINDGLKAFLLRWQGRRDAALPYLERAVERQHDYLWAWREQIDYAFSIQRPDLAEQAARRALKAMPDAPPLMGMLSEALRRQGKRLEANEVASKAIAIASDVPQLWAIQAEIAAEEDDLESALRCARQAAELDRGLEYQALLAQVLIAAGRDDEAAAVVRPLLAHAHPIQPAFELAATLSERRGDAEEARRYCDQALRAGYAHDPRLLVRRARLGLQPGGPVQANAAAVAPLGPLFERTSGVPWRELAQVYANAGQGVMARRAAYLHISQAAQAGAPPGDQAKSWLALAELELALGNTGDCTQALEQCLTRDPDAVPALILAAVLSDQRGDLAAAILHLKRIDRLQARGGAAAAAPATHDAMLHRQLASLYERSGRGADADALWQRLCAGPARPLALCEYACFLLRQERLAEAEAIGERVLPELLPAQAHAPEIQPPAARPGDQAPGARRWRAPGSAPRVRRPARLRPAPGHLEPHPPRPAQPGLRRQRDHAPAARSGPGRGAGQPRHPPAARAPARGHARARPGRGARAPSLVEQAPGDQEAAVLLAECLVQRGHCDRALAALDAPQLPARPALERGLLAALLALDLHGEGACLTRLGRLPVPDLASPLVRVVATAWPGAWCRAEAFAAATPADLRAMPALATLARRLARALSAAARDDLAACLLVSVAEQLQARGEGRDACRLFALAAAALRASGSRAWAWRMAWRSRRPGALLACLLP